MNKKKTMCSVKPLIILLLVMFAGMLIVTGCKKSDDTSGDAKKPSEAVELEVLCGSSFVNPTQQLMDEFTAKTGIKATMSVAGSEDFLPLVQVGSKGDILVTHDPYLDHVSEAKKLEDHVHTGFVAPILAVQKGNPKGVKSISDLTKSGLKVALTDPQYSTCGEMVFKLLETKGTKDEVLANVENRLTKGHSALGTFLKTEAVDAVIMWNGVAHVFRESLEIVPTPYEYDEEIRVHVMSLNYSKKTEALKQFMAFAKERAPAIFTEHGYVK